MKRDQVAYRIGFAPWERYPKAAASSISARQEMSQRVDRHRILLFLLPYTRPRSVFH
jgi:hypothetical protein